VGDENYLFRKDQLLSAFDKSISHAKQSLYSWLGEQQATHIILDSRQEYEAIIPRIPFVGSRNPLLVFLLPATRYLAVYRAFQRQGMTLEDAGYATFLMGTEDLKALPSIARHFIGYFWFSPWFIKRIKQRAMETQTGRYPGNYVLTYVEGDGIEFDYGVDYIECASCKMLRAENAFELAPYVCAVDKTASELLGWGLTRTMTLAEGAPKCDFRFKKGGKTQLVIPPSLQAVLGSNGCG
jgi:hypothetical protein